MKPRASGRWVNNPQPTPTPMAQEPRPQIEGDLRLWRIRGELELLYVHLRNRDWVKARKVLLIIRDEVDSMIDEGAQCRGQANGG